VSLCVSKGLGAPVGSALVGSHEVIDEALRFRKMLGGGMRQIGMLAAGALHALEHHRSRLGDDHARARAIAEHLRDVPGVEIGPVETNIINVDTPGVPARSVVGAARDHGVLIGSSGPCRVRIVTHLDLRAEDVAVASAALNAALREALRSVHA
jgi:threonine aldolase